MPSEAASGISFSIENLFAPLGKQYERVSLGPDGVAPENIQTETVAGRETTEFVGISGFLDINRNWRFQYGAHATLIGYPIVKLDGALAFMLEMPNEVPLQPYFFLGATPVIAADPTFPPLGMTAHGGIGVDYTWQNTLYTSIRFNSYWLTLYGEEANNNLNLEWKSSSFSLSASMGYLF